MVSEQQTTHSTTTNPVNITLEGHRIKIQRTRSVQLDSNRNEHPIGLRSSPSSPSSQGIMTIKESRGEWVYRRIVREGLIPLALMVCTFNCAVGIPYLVVHANSFSRVILNDGPIGFLSKAWASVRWDDSYVWSLVIVTAIWATFSMMLPGPVYWGPPTMTGFRPLYYHSGFAFYLISMAVAIPLIYFFPVLHFYHRLVTFGGVLALVGLIMCFGLFIKGHMAPSPGLFGSSGNPLFDFYWGLELYPRFGPYNWFDLKTIVNCRFGLWLWQLIVLWSWKANFELHKADYLKGNISYAITASTILQTIYLCKFYYWEDGYMSTIDISVDKFGFYVGWGCVAWVPTFYTLTSVYLIKHSPQSFGLGWFIVTVALGSMMIFLNYEADRQRQVFRSTGGQCTFWGRKPEGIHAIYNNQDGEPKRSILLVSGLWGVARHFNYVLELGAALCWALPALNTSLIPYFYFIFLTILLVHRSLRDDDKCARKYTTYWDKYCDRVPYRMVPYIF